MQAVEDKTKEILKQTEAQLQARVQQQAVVAELGQLALTGVELDDLFEKTVSSVTETLGVEFCKILEFLPESQELLLRTGIGWNPDYVGVTIVSAGLETQAGYTLLSAEPVIIEDWLTETRFRPSRLFQDHQVGSGLSVVIGGKKHIFGILSADTISKRKFNHDDIYFLQAMANVLAGAIEQKQAELPQRLLAEAGKILASSLDYRTRLAQVAQLAVPDLADWCSVEILEQDETVSRVAVAHVNPAKVELVRELQYRYPTNWDGPTGVPNVLRTGRSELYPEISDEMLVAAARDEEHLQILRGLQMQSAMMVPLIARGRSLGVMTFVQAESGRRYHDQDLTLAEELARRAATAIDNAWLYEAERRSRKEIEQTLNRLASLQAVTAALSEALTFSQVTDAIIERGLIALKANSGVIMLVDAERQNLEMIGSFGYPVEQIKEWRRFSLSTPVPLAESVLTGEPIFIYSFEALQARYPNLGLEKTAYNQTLATLPLLVREQTIGVIGLSFSQSGDNFSAEMRTFMMSLAHQCAQALERAHLYEAEQQARAEAEATQQRLAALAEIKERNRLAGELHDTVAQALGYLNLKMATVNTLLAQGEVDQVQTSLQELKQIIGETYTDVREEIFNLRSSAVPGIHFLETLEDYLSKYKRFYNLDIKIQREAEQHYFEFPDEVGVQLIRTIQEALINIRKHAQVNEALIRLGRTGTEVWITIEDKGRGFVASELKNESVTSFGIQIMQERIEKVGGRLEIHSVPNQGTQISLYYDKGQGGLNSQEPA